MTTTDSVATLTTPATITGTLSLAPSSSAASNVTAVNTTLAAGTDNQVFCYDEQNRLTWAGSSGTPSCGSTLTPGSLTSASYTQSYAYDILDRLTSGPLGSYTYGDSAHLHGATSIGTTYTASYDAVGNMTCRAADGSTTCSGTPTGAQLTYDNEGRLSHWQNAPTSPTTTDDFLYNGEGNRVEQLVTISGSPVTTVYVAGGLEEVTTSGITTTLTKYFSAAGLPTIERVGTNGPLSYLASDGQGSVSETLDGSGTVTFQQLFTPYGSSRYSNGSSPTTLGYTGQRADANTGLDYYHARYYDPLAGQFGSADTVDDGLNRYGYVGGNPTTATDPSGHRMCYDDTVSSCVPNPKPAHSGRDGNGVKTKKSCSSEYSSVDRNSGNVTLCPPKKVTPYSGGGTPITSVDEYEYCTNPTNCVYVDGFHGNNLKTLIKQDSDHLASDQWWDNFLKTWFNRILAASAVVVALVVAAFIIAAEAAKGLETGVPPDVQGAIATGAGAGTGSTVFIAAILEATIQSLDSDIAATQSRLALENQADKSGSTLWFVNPGETQSGTYTVIESGATPGSAVGLAVAQVLRYRCITGWGWFNNSHDC